MITLLRIVASLMAFGPHEGRGQEGPICQDRVLEEERQKLPERDLQPLHPSELKDFSGDLWYGQPGVRPGGDLLGATLELIRRPSGLVDFRPRPVRAVLPDRETAEFLRERR